MTLRLAFGASGAWAQSWFPEPTARDLVLSALDLGITRFDTAPFYAGGEAERRLGAALAGTDAFISTKTGTRYRPGRPALKDFSEAAIRADVETSLRRLGRDRLDLLYLHGPDEAAIDRALPTLIRLREEGKIAGWGVCGAGAPLERAIDAGAGALMGAYNVLNRAHADVFSRARAKGVVVAAIAPLAQGLYRRGFLAPSTLADGWHLARALVRSRAELHRARTIRPVLEGVEGWDAAAVALAFTLSNRDIDYAVTTTTKAGHLAASAAAAARTLPEDVLRRLTELRA